MAALCKACSMQDLTALTRDRTHAPLQWKNGVLTTGRPGKPQILTVLQIERAQRGQWLAEGQLHKLDQDKARIYFQASQIQAHVTYLPKKAMWDQRKRHLCGRVGGQAEGKHEVTVSRSRWDSVTGQPGLVVQNKVPSEWPFEKAANFWSRSNSPLRTGWALFQEYWCQSLGFVTCFEITGTIPSLQSGLSPSLIWDTSIEAWEGGALSFHLAMFQPFLFYLANVLNLYRMLATITLLHFNKLWLLVNGSWVEQRSVYFILF